MRYIPDGRTLHRFRVFENRVLKKMSALKSQEATGGWKKVNNEELHNL
jgi:hypothetical protein